MFIKIENEIFPCYACYTTGTGLEWNFRNAYVIGINMNYNDANRLFVDGAHWGTVMTENGDGEIDHSDYCIAGRLIDYRNGRIEVLMGQKTEAEKMADENERILPLIQSSLLVLDDKDALEYVKYFKDFNELVKENATEEMGYRFKYNNLLYKVMQPTYIFNDTYLPGEPGSESLFSRVALEEEGIDNQPIAYDNNMELIEGKYYIQDNIIYHCIRNTEVPVYNNLSDLINIYVEIAN